MSVSTGDFQCAADQCLRYSCHALTLGSVELAEREPVAFETLHHARRDDLSCRIDDAADDAMRFDVAFNDSLRVSRLQSIASMRAVEILEIPPWQSVLQRHDDRVLVKHRTHLRRHCGDRVSLYREQHEVLHASIGAACYCAQVDRQFLRSIGVNELEAVGANRFQVRALFDHRDSVARER